MKIGWMCYRCYWRGYKSELKKDRRVKKGFRCPKCGSSLDLHDQSEMTKEERIARALQAIDSTMVIPVRGGPKLVQELSTILGDDDVIEVLEVLMKICPECWNNIKPCWCWK